MYESVNIVFQVLGNLTTSGDESNKGFEKKHDFFSFFNFIYKEKKKPN